MTDGDLRPPLLALIQRWKDPEFWKDTGCRMDSQDCAEELEQVIAPQAPALRDNGKPNATHEYQDDPETGCCVICGWHALVHSEESR